MFRLIRSPRRVTVAIAALGLLGLGGTLVAQIEGGDRGAPPINSSSSFEVSGVSVDIRASNADAARTGGWREAQRRGWKQLWARIHAADVASAPGLPDSTLDSIVSGIVVEDEQIGPTRYIARLGVLFDRARAARYLGVTGLGIRSAPMLVIPVQWSGGVAQTFETRTPWQLAWARFRTGGSAIDYVRPVGNGADPLLMNAAQTRRPGRGWWRLLLDQYGAADIVVPEVALSRQWPGGPVTGRFTARHGPDGDIVTIFTLRSATAASLPAMLDEGVRRIDIAYTQALGAGRLEPDSSLIIEEPVDTAALEAAAAAAADAALAVPALTGPTNGFNVQIDTPDVIALNAFEASLRGVPGVRGTSTSSLALGGVSVLRITFAGDAAAFQAALAARGLRAEDIGGAFRVRRAVAQPAPPLAAPKAAPAAPAAPKAAPAAAPKAAPPAVKAAPAAPKAAAATP